MENKRISDTINLYFDTREKETADIIETACKQSLPVIQATWGLPSPKECRIYVVNSWYYYMFHSAPWDARILPILSFPFWYMKTRRVCKLYGGLTQPHRGRPAIGIKPIKSISKTDANIGNLIYIKAPTTKNKLEHILCHEMTHAFSSHLDLPFWLNEGIAMVSVDMYFGKQTVREDTLKYLKNSVLRQYHVEYSDLPEMKKESIAYYYTRGYWITRFLMEQYPGLLKQMLKKKQSTQSLEKEIASVLGLSRHAFFKTIDNMVLSHFSDIPSHCEQKTPVCV
jgi:hypothetical protein